MAFAKYCSGCELVRPITEFHRRGTGVQSVCKSCKRQTDARDYRKNVAKLMKQKTARRRRQLEWHHQLKRGRPCSICGRVFQPAAMQWDHRPGTKKLGDVASLLNRASRARVEAEIAKCDLVCANCHAIRSTATMRVRFA